MLYYLTFVKTVRFRNLHSVDLEAVGNSRSYCTLILHWEIYLDTTSLLIFNVCHYYRPQRSCEGYVFTGVCLFTVGVYLTRYTPRQIHSPGTRYTPQAGTPPGQVPPQTRYTPLDPGTPPGPGTPPRPRYTPPPDQVHPSRAGTPQTRYTPPGPGTPPPPRYGHCGGRYAFLCICNDLSRVMRTNETNMAVRSVFCILYKVTVPWESM